MSEPDLYILNSQLRNQVINYLSSRPYVEVFQLIEKLMATPEFDPENFGGPDAEPDS